MIEIDSPPELNILRGYANAISDFISYTNYGAGVDVQGFIISDSQFILKDVLQFAFPHWERDETQTILCSVEDFNATISRCLNFDFHYYTEISERHQYKVADLNQQINFGFLSAIKAYINYEQSKIYLCKDSIGVMWSFTFIIYDNSIGRCLVLDGAADD